MIRCVTKDTHFQVIDGNILKSRKTCLTNHTWSISLHTMPLVINVLGADTQTDKHTHTHMLTSKQKRLQGTRCMAFGCAHLVNNMWLLTTGLLSTDSRPVNPIGGGGDDESSGGGESSPLNL